MVTGLVHDYLLVMRGAERTFAHIAACFPSARIFTLLYDERGTEGMFAGRVAGASRLQRLPVRQRGFRKLLPLFPRAIDRMELGDHEAIVSSSSAFGHGIRVNRTGAGSGAFRRCRPAGERRVLIAAERKRNGRRRAAISRTAG